TVLVAGFPAGSFAANCYVVAPAAGEECVIIAPGENAEAGIEELLREHRLKPGAVLLTRRHLDHVRSVAPGRGPQAGHAYVHPGARAVLTDPAKGLSLGAGQQLLGGLKLSEPDDVQELSDGTVLELAGLRFTVDHAPGHTPGSVTFRTPRTEQIPDVMFTGDLLFAGSIGRTDLPGGSYEQILESLARVCLTT